MTEVAAILQDIKGVPVEAISVSPGAAIASGADPGMIQSYDWDNVEGYKVNIPALAVFGIVLTPFKTWAWSS